jgi:hypothetical protein
LVEQVGFVGFLIQVDNLINLPQIRRYASILAATRESQEKGDKPDDMDVTE